MGSIDAVCVDVVNTIAHDGCVASFVPNQTGKVIACPVKERLARIAVELPVILVTGRPWADLDGMLISSRIYHAVTEHGGVLWRNGTMDQDYFSRIKPYAQDQESGWLWVYEHELSEKKLHTKHLGRLGSFVICQHEWTLEQKYAFTRETHPHDIQAVLHEHEVDVMPPGVSKLVGVEYLLGKLGINWERVAYLGDDHTDMPMLSRAGYPVTHSTAEAAVKADVRAMKGYVSALGSHKGAEEMLSYVQGLMRPAVR